MQSLYPAGPAGVPADLTQPTPAYRRHAWLAMGGLALFVAFYIALSGWFLWTAWRLLSGVFQGNDFSLWTLLAGACAAFLALFMLKALVFVKHGHESDDIEVRRNEEPQLFEFLDRLADEAGAPRPHRVFLSARVNAAVFYDLSILNLIYPSKKNLEIGLGLVNVLTLGELKAVLAHEFGHFAQKSMAVGRWVYIAQQIATHVISRRDAPTSSSPACRVSTCESPGSAGCFRWSSGRSARSWRPCSASSSSASARCPARWSCRPTWWRCPSPGAMR